MKYCFRQDAGTQAAPHKIYLYDEITATGAFNWETWEFEQSETSAKHFRELLEAIPDTDQIELHVNSAGGEISEGTAIYNMIRQKSKAGSRIVGYVDGMAYSIAMDIILACDEIHMGLGTSMFLHYPWTVARGNAETLLSVAEQLEALGNASVQLYLERSNGTLTEQELREMMRKETCLEPDMCLKYGFCDVVDKDRKAVDQTPKQDNEELAALRKQVKEQADVIRELNGQIGTNKRRQTIAGAAALFKAGNIRR